MCNPTSTEQQLKSQLMFRDSLFMIFKILVKNKSPKYSHLISESCNDIGCLWLLCSSFSAGFIPLMEWMQLPDIFISAQLAFDTSLLSLRDFHTNSFSVCCRCTWPYLQSKECTNELLPVSRQNYISLSGRHRKMRVKKRTVVQSAWVAQKAVKMLTRGYIWQGFEEDGIDSRAWQSQTKPLPPRLASIFLKRSSSCLCRNCQSANAIEQKL
jgi:hypothetical protein